MDVFWSDLGSLLAAMAAGALIGLERELADKPAGLRTNIMICLGAALFTLISIRLAEGSGSVDRTRIAAQVVTGVGFLGAGAIIQHRAQVVGLTTAATIWAVASVGMAFGAGEFVVGVLGAVLATGVLFGLRFAEGIVSRLHTVAIFELELDAGIDAEVVISQQLTATGVRRRSWVGSRTRDGTAGQLVAVGSASRLTAFEQALWAQPGVRVLKRL